MTDQQQEMIEYTTQEVVGYLIEDNAITIEQAMEPVSYTHLREKIH